LIKRRNSEKNDLNNGNSQKNEEMEGKKEGIRWISSQNKKFIIIHTNYMTKNK
jgi:hypothetical protein